MDCLPLQSVLGGWQKDAPASGLAPEAAQALRDAAQEDFETYEASEDDQDMDEDAAEDEDADDPSESNGETAQTCWHPSLE